MSVGDHDAKAQCQGHGATITALAPAASLILGTMAMDRLTMWPVTSLILGTVQRYGHGDDGNMAVPT
jgi:hypothetical protein